jgi:hypothetical protein
MSRGTEGALDSCAITRLRRVIERYERDIGLLSGKVIPLRRDLDDLIVMDDTLRGGPPRDFVLDRRLRVQILRATITLLSELARPAA